MQHIIKVIQEKKSELQSRINELTPQLQQAKSAYESLERQVNTLVRDKALLDEELSELIKQTKN